MMRRIKLRHLDTLSVFMKTGSVTEAALVLGTTQPNASKSLKQLEEAVGLTLFQRVAGRLRPTPEAEVLHGHASRLMHELTLFENLSIDLVALRDDGRALAVEVKLANTVTDSDTKHLHWLADRMGDKLLDAIVINTGPNAYRRHDGIAVVPLGLLAP